MNEAKSIIIKGEGKFVKPQPRVIKPSKNFLHKLYFELLFYWLIFLAIYIIYFFIIDLMIFKRYDVESDSVASLIFLFTHLIFWSGSLLYGILSPILVKLYIDSIRYIVHGDEIVVYKGIFTKTTKFVPYRTVVNLSTTTGLIDRLFKVGSIEIETAGKSSRDYEPVEKIGGLIRYNEIRDFILSRIRTYHSSIGITEQKINQGGSIEASDLKTEYLTTIKEIKTLLKEKTNKEEKKW